MIYHGGKIYNIDKRFSSKFNVQANTEKFIPDFEYLLFDFSKYSDLEFKDYDFDIMHDKVNLIIPERSETFKSTANKLREEGKLDGIKKGIKEGRKEGMKEGRKQELIETISILIKDKLPIDNLPDNLESKLNKLDLIVLREIRTDLLKDIINIESLEDLEEYLN